MSRHTFPSQQPLLQSFYHFYSLFITFAVFLSLLQFFHHFYTLFITFTVLSSLLHSFHHFYSPFITFTVLSSLLQSFHHFCSLFITFTVLSSLLQAEPEDVITYDSDSEATGGVMSGRKKQGGSLPLGVARNKHGTPLYSRQDIREQYCINDKELLALESRRKPLFGCLVPPSPQVTSCSI